MGWSNFPDPHGIQTPAEWPAGDVRSRTLLDLGPNGALWRVELIGDVLATLSWGTTTMRTLVLDAPLVADLPGNVSIAAVPRTAGGARASVTVAQVGAAGRSELRRFVEGPLLALDDSAVRFVALAASTVTVRALAVALAVGQSIPLVSGSVLTAGSGYQEFEP